MRNASRRPRNRSWPLQADRRPTGGMFGFMFRRHSKRAGEDFSTKLVRRLVCHRSNFSRVEVSDKAEAVQRLAGRAAGAKISERGSRRKTSDSSTARSAHSSAGLATHGHAEKILSPGGRANPE